MGTSTSCDPLYRFTAQEFATRIAYTYETVVTGAKADRDRYAWEEIGSPERMGEVRMAAIRRFLEDFAPGLEKGRYRPDRLPSRGFKNGEFALALSSHFLFTYSQPLSADFHVAAIGKMCRVTDEARIFPLLNYDGWPSRLLRPVVSENCVREGIASHTRCPTSSRRAETGYSPSLARPASSTSTPPTPPAARPQGRCRLLARFRAPV